MVSHELVHGRESQRSEGGRDIWLCDAAKDWIMVESKFTVLMFGPHFRAARRHRAVRRARPRLADFKITAYICSLFYHTTQLRAWILRGAE